jgi:hypothetical protein
MRVATLRRRITEVKVRVPWFEGFIEKRRLAGGVRREQRLLLYLLQSLSLHKTSNTFRILSFTDSMFSRSVTYGLYKWYSLIVGSDLLIYKNA